MTIFDFAIIAAAMAGAGFILFKVARRSPTAPGFHQERGDVEGDQ